ncbi:hypothetical protein EV356DRAFT_502790, partial [Viridothelium virens]
MSLDTILAELNLSQYLQILLDNGFDTWDVVQDITEEDLRQLGFKLGHRRILQRAIAESPICDSNSRSSTPLSRGSYISHSPKSSVGSITKRRYRRHPRADPHAPKRPKTAYVMFADHLRTDPVISSLSFIEISRVVGMRWQAMPREEKFLWDIRAARAMQFYTETMQQYRRTDTFREHQRYLEEFRRRYEASPSIEGCDSALPPQRPSLEALKGQSSSSGSSHSMRMEHSDDSARLASPDGSEITEYDSAEVQNIGESEIRRGARSSIHALLQAAEESERMESARNIAEDFRHGGERRRVHLY